MKIYDEQGRLLEAAPDPETGWLEPTQRLVQHHPEAPAVPARTHPELMAGTEDLYHLVVDEPARAAVPAWDEFETVQVYHHYTAEELAELAKPTMEQRVGALERAALNGGA